MPVAIKVKAKRLRVLFVPKATRQADGELNASSSTTSRDSGQGESSRRPTITVTLPLKTPSASRSKRRKTVATDPNDIVMEGHFGTPPGRTIFTSSPRIRDALETETSKLQDETVENCLPLLNGIGEPSRNPFVFNSNGLPKLEREMHVEFLHQSLGWLSSRYTGFDASRPWILYWALTGLCLLGEDVRPYRERVMQTLSPMQNPSGGFGGGHGQASHCAPSYAAILSLAMMGGAASLDLIDRRALWRWLGELKQPDGGFVVCVGGEEDVRGAYCSMVIMSLLSLPLELPPNAPARKSGLTSFSDRLPQYLSRCQTFEGGISGAPQTEAHGAYAFCALACLCILGPPQEMIPQYLDIPSLISWLSAKQYAPEGGFAGRTNKLVDGCYSHWVGGCWPLVDAALTGPQSQADLETPTRKEALFSQKGLARYILCCCQSEDGGLRDKPSTRADAYHSCYTLAGLSSIQHKSYYKTPYEHEATYPLDAALRWASLPIDRGDADELRESIFDEEHILAALHPIYVIPWADVDQTHKWFARKAGF